MTDALKLLEQDIEKSTGLSIEYIRKTPIDEIRAMLLEQGKEDIFYKSSRIKTLSSKEINENLDNALREK
jgi:hypothetical protein